MFSYFKWSSGMTDRYTFLSMLFKDDNWIIFMINIIAWITKDKQNSQDKPLKILMISS
jgi:hypothetical protein